MSKRPPSLRSEQQPDLYTYVLFVVRHTVREVDPSPLTTGRPTVRSTRTNTTPVIRHSVREISTLQCRLDRQSGHTHTSLSVDTPGSHVFVSCGRSTNRRRTTREDGQGSPSPSFPTTYLSLQSQSLQGSPDPRSVGHSTTTSVETLVPSYYRPEVPTSLCFS